MEQSKFRKLIISIFLPIVYLIIILAILADQRNLDAFDETWELWLLWIFISAFTIIQINAPYDLKPITKKIIDLLKDYYKKKILPSYLKFLRYSRIFLLFLIVVVPIGVFIYLMVDKFIINTDDQAFEFCGISFNSTRNDVRILFGEPIIQGGNLMNLGNRKKLYNQVSQHLDIGPFDQFNSAMDDPIRRKKFFDVVLEHLDLNTFEYFESKMVSDIVNGTKEKNKRNGWQYNDYYFLFDENGFVKYIGYYGKSNVHQIQGIHIDDPKEIVVKKLGEPSYISNSSNDNNLYIYVYLKLNTLIIFRGNLVDGLAIFNSEKIHPKLN